MELTFSPSADVACILNALLDIFERRTSQVAKSPTEHVTRTIKVTIGDISLPSYFSQTDPTPRIMANEQFQTLEHAGMVKLKWISGETGHLLQAVSLATEHATRVYQVVHRSAKTDQRSRLESLLLADKFRFVGDWRGRTIRHVLANLRAGKAPAPFSLTDTDLDIDLLTVMEALPTLQAETPYRVFSVRVFNDSKRLEAIKNQLVGLARLGNPEWKRLPIEEVLRELNLVPNPTYLHLAGNWELTLQSGEVLNLGGFYPSVGFPAAQTSQLRAVQIHADGILCIENLTTFHEFVRLQEAAQRNTQYEPDGACSVSRYAVLCTYGNPPPALRRILRLVPESTPIFHWSDLDYGGFNILSQLRRLVSEYIQPYRMDIVTLDTNYPRSRPLTAADKTNLKKLLIRPELRDVRMVVEHLLLRGVKLEQEGVEN